MSFVSGLWSMFPRGYRWQIAIKKISYTLAKIAVSLVAVKFGKDVDLTMAQEAMAMAIGGGLTTIHDWLQVKYPDSKWL